MAVASIRDAWIGDAEQVAQLITELGYPTTLEAMKERLALILADPACATFVADTRRPDRVAGATLGRYYEKDGMYARLVVLAVGSTARGAATGRQLMETVDRWAATRGAREVVVHSGLHRAEAHEFYERCGYARTGFRFVKELDVGS